MANIKLLDPFKDELRATLRYSLNEFGTTTVLRFNQELDNIQKRLKIHPLSSPKEPLLKNFLRPYRSTIIRKKMENHLSV